MYPWHSVDSSGWVRAGGFGTLTIPHKRGGVYVYRKPNPYQLYVSDTSSQLGTKGHHLFTLKKSERKIVEDWIEHIEIPLGKTEEDGEIVEDGVINNHILRRIANMLFYKKMWDSAPEYPWPFHATQRKGFGLT